MSINTPITAQNAYEAAYNGYRDARRAGTQNTHMNEDALAGAAQTQLLAHTYNAVQALQTQMNTLSEQVGQMLNRRI